MKLRVTLYAGWGAVYGRAVSRILWRGKSRGEMPEWSNGAVSKTVVPARVPRVRIPLSPPLFVSRQFHFVQRLQRGGLSSGRAVALPSECSGFPPNAPPFVLSDCVFKPPLSNLVD